MNHNQIASITFIAVCGFIAALTQSTGAFLCLAVALILFGFILWLERNKLDDLKGLKDEIASVKDKVNSIQLSRLSGR